MSSDHGRLSAALRAHSNRHAGDLMVGRTLLQPAPPITFGLKAAGWFAAEHRSWRRVVAAHEASAVVQFGGASGTLASLSDRGLDVASHMASALRLGTPPAPWHAAHDALAAFVAACGIYTGALGKMARDVALLMQAEVAEAFEPGGRSSTMPHKRNPASCAVVLAAATRMPGLVCTMLASLTHEHERAVGGWQAEWPTVCDAIQTTGAALDAAVGIAEGLTADTARMRQNLEAVREAVLTERLMLRAGAALGRDLARGLVRDALAEAADGRSLADAIARRPELRAVLTDEDLRLDASTYLGEAEIIRRRLLETD
jgi:3-carboxy-cis,cis-muconate cycloisomerase